MTTWTSEPRRLAAAAAALAVLVLLAVLLLRGGGSTGAGGPPAALATRLVPADALVYLHLSTDTGRSGTADAARLAKAFPGFERERRSIIRRLSAPGCPLPASALRDGHEAALALVDTGGGTAGSLVYVDTGSDAKAPDRTCGGVQTTKLGRFLVIGQAQTLPIAKRLAAGKGRALADVAGYRRTLAELPKDRVADAWASKAGVERLLAPQGGLLGAAGTLLDQPGLVATALAVTAAGAHGAKVELRTLRSASSAAAGAFTSFTPTIQDAVPASAFGMLAVQGLPGAATRLLGIAGAGAAGLAPLLARAGADLAPLAGVFAGQVAVTVTAATPAPVLSLITRPADPAAAAKTLAAARPKIARLLAPTGGPVPEWKVVGDGFRLRPGAGIEIDYAVVRGLVVVSTRSSGIAAVRDRTRRLTDTVAWRGAVGEVSGPVTSLGFLDFNQLLRLGEQTGLNDSRAYVAVQRDLQRLRSVGVRSSSAGDESTLELFLSLP
ncbi:hypothetical protein NBH00_17445 [Paraconexibacter antarcticus]|uniref:DUF3352 domain-containing protein n=1 Tax=Paraconexibacter antarcticus TaxID=2949664 RepID=A0ABY5DQR3_9ACTN|nr:hypothetical protein [Paraconexibacter antarcticus]UTI63137.1 hypothetical protein NBH00_17445 [Paraconexibacter antarcticus]